MPTDREQLKLSRYPKFDCKCIDAESLANIRLALITAKDTYNDIASRLIKMESYKPTINIENIQEQSRKFHMLLHELDKIPSC